MFSLFPLLLLNRLLRLFLLLSTKSISDDLIFVHLLFLLGEDPLLLHAHLKAFDKATLYKLKVCDFLNK